MSAGYEAVHARRARLLERAASEREELAHVLGAWQKPLGAVDLGLAFVRVLKRSAPVIGAAIGVGMAALAFVRPANLGGWLEGGQAVWRLLTDRDLGAARNLARVVKEARPGRSQAPSAGGDPAA